MKKIKKRDLISFACVFCSSLIMAATTKTFVRPAHLLSGGFMGIALLVDMIADLFGKSIPTAFTLVVLNVPVALICAKKISKRFVFFSLYAFLMQIKFCCRQLSYNLLFVLFLHFELDFLHHISLN